MKKKYIYIFTFLSFTLLLLYLLQDKTQHTISVIWRVRIAHLPISRLANIAAIEDEHVLTHSSNNNNMCMYSAFDGHVIWELPIDFNVIVGKHPQLLFIEGARFGLINVDKQSTVVCEYPSIASCSGAISKDGKSVWISASRQGRIDEYKSDGSNLLKAKSFDIHALLGDFLLAQSERTELTILCESDGELLVFYRSHLIAFDSKSGLIKNQLLLPITSEPRSLKISKSSTKLALVADSLVLIDLNNFSITFSKKVDGFATAVDFSTDENSIYLGYSKPYIGISLLSRRGDIDQFDITGNLLKKWSTKLNFILALYITNNGSYIITNDELIRFDFE